MSGTLLHFRPPAPSADERDHLLPVPDIIGIGRAVLAGEIVLPAETAMATLHTVACAVTELRIVIRLAHLHTLFPAPVLVLASEGHRHLVRLICGVQSDELLHVGDALFATITSACREAATDLDDKFDPEAWADVLVEILRPQRPAVSGACEVHDIETLRLIRSAKRGAFCGASDVEGDDVA